MVNKPSGKELKKGFIEAERDAMTHMSANEREDALVALASQPVKPYLIGIIDELVRQGIYLTPEEQAGAKLMIKILGAELQKGSQLIEKRNRKPRAM